MPQIRAHRVRLAATIVLAGALVQPGSSMGTSTPDYGGYRPHYQGYGIDTPGGRGGAILRVTNLSDSGPGSLRAAVEAAGPRIVIFETSGTIALRSTLYVRSPYITIAGQTAPSPGINIRGWPLVITTSHVVVQHLRFRTGTGGMPLGGWGTIQSGMDGGIGYSSSHVILDHVSVAWNMYMNWLIFSSDSSVLDSIGAFGLDRGGSYTGMGGAIRERATHARNLYVHNSHRQPITGPGGQIASLGSMFNNVIYGSGPGDEAEDYTFTMFWPNSCGGGHSTDTDAKHSSYLAYVNNVVIPSQGIGNGSSTSQKPFFLNINRDNLTYQRHELWMRGNQSPHLKDGFTGPDEDGQWAGVLPSTVCNNLGSRYAGVTDLNTLRSALAPSAEPSWHAQFNYSILATEDVPAFVFANAGARPLDRDRVDQAAVAQAQAGLTRDTNNMGGRVKSESDMGGHPILAQHIRLLDVPANPHTVAPGQKFRTNIEMWLEDFARLLEPRWLQSRSVSEVEPPPPPPNVRIVH